MYPFWSKMRSQKGLAFLLLVLCLAIVLGWSYLSQFLHWVGLLTAMISAPFALVLLIAPMNAKLPSRTQSPTPTIVPPSPSTTPSRSSSTTTKGPATSIHLDEDLPYVPRTLREAYKRLTPKEFEIFSAALIIAQEDGHRFLEHCGQSGDQGVDTKLRNRFGNIVIVQSKLYAPTNRVGQPELRDFFGSTYHHKSVYGYFVTTSTFTRAARQFIYANGSRIRAIDGSQIETLLQKKRQNIALALRDIQQQMAALTR